MFLTFSSFCFVDALRGETPGTSSRLAASMTAAARAVAPSKTARSAAGTAVRRTRAGDQRGERLDAEVGVDVEKSPGDSCPCRWRHGSSARRPRWVKGRPRSASVPQQVAAVRRCGTPSNAGLSGLISSSQPVASAPASKQARTRGSIRSSSASEAARTYQRPSARSGMALGASTAWVTMQVHPHRCGQLLAQQSDRDLGDSERVGGVDAQQLALLHLLARLVLLSMSTPPTRPLRPGRDRTAAPAVPHQWSRHRLAGRTRAQRRPDRAEGRWSARRLAGRTSTRSTASAPARRARWPPAASWRSSRKARILGTTKTADSCY